MENLFWSNPNLKRKAPIATTSSVIRANNTRQANGHYQPPEKQQRLETNGDGLRKPVSELPIRFRGVFPYISLNHVQSLVYETMLESSQPIVVSAPTGSGKTGVFELAIIKMIMDSESRGVDFGANKVVYLAPTKALCSERRDDWAKKFGPFNLPCFELTSDINQAINYKNLQKSCILLATPEKWDSITRSWIGQRAFVQSIRLLLIDEVHLINDGARGATLEAVISRMKTIRSMIWPTEPDKLRFVAVSATVSNVQDIAEWFSTAASKAQVYKVDPRERPVKLRTLVLGYTANVGVNEFSFDSLLNHKLAGLIKEHSNEKPTLVFCATRRSAMIAATTIIKEGQLDACFSSDRRNRYLQLASQLRDKNLQETARLGIAFHHAGLCAGDRKLIEAGFTDGRIMVLCCTSTLAMGVNLPAHLVIIKNTSYYDEGQFKSYSESSLVQMIGRAGRPQYDTEATAVIMTKSFCRDEIEKMLTGKLIVDSQLHKFLTEHLNSEIVLGTITDDSIARKWLNSTYLHVRLMKCPENYGLNKKSTATAKESTIIKWCSNSIELLLKYNIAKRGSQGQLQPTDAGRAMARHYICLTTMVKLVQLTGNESLWDLLQMVTTCNEVAGDIQLRNEDKSVLVALNNPKDEELKLRFPSQDKTLTREKKAATLIQATFGNVTISDTGMAQESIRIVRNATRVVSCLRDVSLTNGKIGYKLLLNVLTLSQCFSANLWEDSIYVSRQLEKIGNVLSQTLAKNGLINFELLRKASPRNIEIFCGRLPPFGSHIQQTCFGLPIYDLRMSFRSIPNMIEKIQLLVEVTIVNGQDMRTLQTLPKYHSCVLLVGNVKDNKLLLTQHVSDGTILSRPDMTLCFGADVDKLDLPDNHEVIECRILSELFVGLNVCRSVNYVEPEDDFN